MLLYLILLLSFLFPIVSNATVPVERFPSGTPVQVCTPSDTNNLCGGGTPPAALWTESSGNLYPTTLSDKVGIGVIPTTPFQVGDETTLNSYIQGYTGGSYLFSLLNPTNGAIMGMEVDYTGYGPGTAQIIYGVALSDNPSGILTGMEFDPILASGSPSGKMIGFTANPYAQDGTASGSFEGFYYFSGSRDTPTISSDIGFNAIMGQDSMGTNVASAIAFNANVVNADSSTGTAIGLNVNDLTTAATNYAIKTGIGSVVFGGSSPIGNVNVEDKGTSTQLLNISRYTDSLSPPIDNAGEHSTQATIVNINDDDYSTGTYGMPLSGLIVQNNYNDAVMYRGYEIQAFNTSTGIPSNLYLNEYGGDVQIGNISNSNNISLYANQLEFETGGLGDGFQIFSGSSYTFFASSSQMNFSDIFGAGIFMNGKVGIGTSTVNYALDINDSTSTGYDIGNSTTGDWNISNVGQATFSTVTATQLNTSNIDDSTGTYNLANWNGNAFDLNYVDSINDSWGGSDWNISNTGTGTFNNLTLTYGGEITFADGSTQSTAASGSSPGGSTYDVQYNNYGSFEGNSGLTTTNGSGDLFSSTISTGINYSSDGLFNLNGEYNPTINMNVLNSSSPGNYYGQINFNTDYGAIGGISFTSNNYTYAGSGVLTNNCFNFQSYAGNLNFLMRTDLGATGTINFQNGTFGDSTAVAETIFNNGVTTGVAGFGVNADDGTDYKVQVSGGISEDAGAVKILNGAISGTNAYFSETATASEFTDGTAIMTGGVVTATVVPNLSTGSNTGTPVTMCTDTNGALCSCGTCA